MLTMKNEIFHFAPLPHFTLGYPNSLRQLPTRQQDVVATS